MITITLHWPPKIETDEHLGPIQCTVEALPRQGDMFELEKGNTYTVDYICFYVVDPGVKRAVYESQAHVHLKCDE